MLYDLLKPALFALDAEDAHDEVSGLMATLAALPGAGLLSALGKITSSPKTVFGVTFPNPIGLAAGFDKNGKLVTVLPALGFGFIEIGSVTLEPQPGNPQPRMFRLPEERALINRMGFNSLGAREVSRLLAAQEKPTVPLGINLGLNKTTEAKNAPKDYARTFSMLKAYGDYFVINVSSPNTPGLRDLQKTKDLTDILNAVRAENENNKPVLVKISPDLNDDDMKSCVSTASTLAQGLVITNTTINHAGEKGGLSGAPLKNRSLEVLKAIRAQTNLPIISVGGIETPEDANERLTHGADLVQIYTAMIYGGPLTAKRIASGIKTT